MTGIFIDLDGTLLNDDNKISKEDLLFTSNLAKRHNVYLITGMSHKKAMTYYNKIGLNTYLTSFQGQVITKEDKVIKESFVSSRDVKKLLAQNFDNFIIEYKDSYYESGSFNLDLKIDKKKIDKLSYKKIYSVYLKTKKEVKTNLAQHKWRTGKAEELIVLRNKSINKERAFNLISKRDKLSRTIYIGNGRNDINSMKKATISIAIKGSSKEVLKAADKVSKKDNNNSGVKEALSSLGL